VEAAHENAKASNINVPNLPVSFDIYPKLFIDSDLLRLCDSLYHPDIIIIAWHYNTIIGHTYTPGLGHPHTGTITYPHIGTWTPAHPDLDTRTPRLQYTHTLGLGHPQTRTWTPAHPDSNKPAHPDSNKPAHPDLDTRTPGLLHTRTPGRDSLPQVSSVVRRRITYTSSLLYGSTPMLNKRKWLRFRMYLVPTGGGACSKALPSSRR
jgi:hypothetical protein